MKTAKPPPEQTVAVSDNNNQQRLESIVSVIQLSCNQVAKIIQLGHCLY